jgi:LysR family transcriptional regulator, repressor for citA
MEFSWITTFLTAAQSGTFRRTADILYISQPSVTVHIKNLESELGVPLFLRDGKKVKLTEEGKRFYEHAKNVLKVYQDGLEDLQSLRQGFTTKLTLGISPLIADTILPFVLKTYLKKHPQVEISVKIIELSDIEHAVLTEEVDLGLSCLNCVNSELMCELLYKDKVILVASHDGMDFETAPPFDEEEILTDNYLLTHNHPAYWGELCRRVKMKYPHTRMMKVSQLHITKRFISEGLGISFLPASTVRRELLEGRLIEVPCSSIELPEANTYAIKKYDHSKQREFLEFVSHYRI